jgi:Cu(I)/Ag(I) efflux system membrane protein CusA/SilA
VCILFLLHMRSALVAIFTLPTAILIAFIVMREQGINANIMSLGGIAIAIGAMVDAAIIMIENAHKHIEREHLLPPEKRRPHWQVVTDAAQEVGPSLFYSLLVITVSFLPVFTLQAQGRTPLPAPRVHEDLLDGCRRAALGDAGSRADGLLDPRKDPSGGEKPDQPASDTCLMPPLYEGDLLYMPTTLPGISITKSKQVLQQTDRIIKQFPEVHHVLGKAGRAETATDPASLDMFETTIMLKPESEWRPGMTSDKLVQELNSAIQFPGVTNAWTMPIKTRTDMLSTGIKTPVGIKIGGPDLSVLEQIGKQVEAVVRGVQGTLSAFAERSMGGNYLDVRINRPEIARYGLTVEGVQRIIQTAVGGMTLTTTVEGLERYPVNLRYPRELRDDPQKLGRILVPTPTGAQIPLAELASLEFQRGPMVVRSEGTRPNAWVYVDISGIDVGTYVKNAQKAVADQVKLPAGYTLTWSGQFEYMQRAQRRLMMVVPLTIFIIFLILYLNTRSLTKTAIVFLAVPFSLVGAVWILFLSGYNLSIAVWVGLIALAGLDAETGVVMLLYLDQAFDQRRHEGQMRGLTDLREAIDHGAVKRVRPKIMTAATIIAGLLPILWSRGAGADVMKRIAAPMVGGVVTSVLMELAVYPAIYFLWRGRAIKREAQREGHALAN